MRGYILLAGILMLVGSFLLGELASIFVPLEFITKNSWWIMPIAIASVAFGLGIADPKTAVIIAVAVFLIIIVSNGSLLDSIKGIGGGT